jgi:membrane protein YdbS with pleckstrin-like domain
MRRTQVELDPGEQIVFETRLHPVVLGSTVSFALFVLFVVALVVTRNELSGGTIALLWLAGVVVDLVSLAPPYLRWRLSRFVVTNRRVLVRLGVMRVHRVDVPIARAVVDVEPTIAGRQLGYGTLRVGERGGIVEAFERVAFPDRVRDAVVGAAASPSARRAR